MGKTDSRKIEREILELKRRIDEFDILKTRILGNLETISSNERKLMKKLRETSQIEEELRMKIKEIEKYLKEGKLLEGYGELEYKVDTLSKKLKFIHSKLDKEISEIQGFKGLDKQLNNYKKEIEYLKEEIISLENRFEKKFAELSGNIVENKRQLTEDIVNIIETIDNLSVAEINKDKIINILKNELKDIKECLSRFKDQEDSLKENIIEKIKSELDTLYNNILVEENKLSVEINKLKKRVSEIGSVSVDNLIDNIRDIVEKQISEGIKRLKVNQIRLDNEVQELYSLFNELRNQQNDTSTGDNFAQENIEEFKEKIMNLNKLIAESEERLDKRIYKLQSSLNKIENSYNIVSGRITGIEERMKKADNEIKVIREELRCSGERVADISQTTRDEIINLKKQLEKIEEAIDEKISLLETRNRVLSEDVHREIARIESNIQDYIAQGEAKNADIAYQIRSISEKLEVYRTDVNKQISQLAIGKSQIKLLKEALEKELEKYIKESLEKHEFIQKKISEFNTMIESVVKLTKELNDEQKAEIEKIRHEFEGFKLYVNDNFSELNARFDELTASKENMLKNLEKISHEGRKLIEKLNEGATFEEQIKKKIEKLEKTSLPLKFNEDIDYLKKVYKNLETKYKQLSQNLERTLSEYEENKENKINALTEKIESMRRRIIELENIHTEDYKGFEEEIISLKDKLSQVDKSLTEFREKINIQINELISGKIQISNIEDMIQTQFKNFSEAVEANIAEKIDNEISALRENLNSLEEELYEKYGAVELRNQFLKQSIDQQIDEIREKISNLTKQGLVNQQTLDNTLKDIIEKINSLNLSLNQRIRNLLLKEFQVETLQEDLRNIIENKINNLEQRAMEKIERKMNSVFEQIDNLELKLSERINSLENRINNSLASLDSSCESLSDRLNSISNNMIEKNTEIEEKLVKIRKEMIDRILSKTKELNDSFIAETGIIRNIITSTYETAESSVKNIKEKLELLEKKISEKEISLAEIKETILSLDDIKDNLESIVDNHIASSLGKNLSNFRDDIENIISSISAKIENIRAEFSNEISRLDEKISDIKSESEGYQNQTKSLLDLMDNKIKSYEEENKRFLKNLQAISENGKMLIDRMKSASEFEKEIKEKIENIEKRLEGEAILPEAEIKDIVDKAMRDFESTVNRINIEVERLAQSLQAIESEENELHQSLSSDIFELSKKLTDFEQVFLKEKRELDLSLRKIISDSKKIRNEIEQQQTLFETRISEKFKSIEDKLISYGQNNIAELKSQFEKEKSVIEDKLKSIEALNSSLIKSFSKKIKELDRKINDSYISQSRAIEQSRYRVDSLIERFEDIETKYASEFNNIKERLTDNVNVLRDKIKSLSSLLENLRQTTESLGDRVSVAEATLNRNTELLHNLVIHKEEIDATISQLKETLGNLPDINSIQTILAKIDAKVVDTQKSAVLKINSMEQQIKQRYSDINEKILTLKDHIGKIDSLLVNYDNRINTTENEVQKSKTNISELSNKIELVEQQVSGNSKKLSDISDNIFQLEEKIGKIEGPSKQIWHKLQIITENGQKLVKKLEESAKFEKDITEKIAELEKRLSYSPVEERIMILEKTIADISAKINKELTSISDNFADEKQLDALKQDISSISERISKEREFTESLVVKIDELINDFDNYKKIVGEEIKFIKNSLMSEIAFKEEYFEDRKRLYQEIQGIIDEYESFSVEIRNMVKKSLENLRNEIEDSVSSSIDSAVLHIKNNIVSLEKELDIVEKELTQKLEDISMSYEAKNNALRQEIIKISDSLSGEINRLRGQFESETDRIVSDISDKVDSFIKEYEGLRDIFEEKINAHIIEIFDEKNRKISSLVENLDNKIKSINKEVSENIANLSDNIDNIDKRNSELILNLSKKIDEISQSTKKSYNIVISRINTIENRLTENYHNFNTKIKEINEKIKEEIDTKIGTLNNRVDTITSDLSDNIDQLRNLMNTKISELKSSVSNINDSFGMRIKNISESLEKIDRKLTDNIIDIQGKIKENVTEIESLKQNFEHKSSELEYKIDLDINKMKSEVDRQLQDHKKQNDDLISDKIEEINTRISSLEANMNNRISLIEENQLKYINNIKSDLLSYIDEIMLKESSIRDLADNLQKELIRLKDEIDNIRSSTQVMLDNLKKDLIQDYTEKNNQLREKVKADISTVEKKISSLEENLTDKIRHLRKYGETSVSELKKSYIEIEERLNRVSEIFSEEKERLNDTLNSIINNKQAEFSKIIDSKIQDLLKSQKQINEIRKNLAKLVVKDVLRNNKELKEEISSLKERVSSLTQIRREFILLKKDLEGASYDKVLEEIEKLKYSLESLRKKIETDIKSVTNLVNKNPLSISDAESISSTLEELDKFLSEYDGNT